MKHTIYLLLIHFVTLAQTDDATQVALQMQQIPADFTTSTTALAYYIDAHFNTDEAKLLAAFYWTANNISYDVNFDIQNAQNVSSEININHALQRHSGVCMHYAEVLNSIANQLRIETYIVSGIVKNHGRISGLSHAWCVAKLNNSWYAFDPTWGAGYVSQNRFYKKYNSSFFKMKTDEVIATHFPFDYMWQLTRNPIDLKEFMGSKKHGSGNDFDFEKALANWKKLDEVEQTKTTYSRTTNNEANLLNVKNYRLYMEQKINVDELNSIVTAYNLATKNLNHFIDYRNKRFMPSLPDYELKNFIENPYNQLLNCKERLEKINYVGNQNLASVSALNKELANQINFCNEQLQFVADYLKKSKVGRKMMFLSVRVQH